MASSRKSTLRWQWLAAVLWAILLILLSAAPAKSLPKVSLWTDLIGVDKLAHALVYGVFTVLLYLPFRKSVINAGFWSVFVATAFGGLMELLQATLSTGRAYDLADMLANFVGAVIAYFASYYWIKRQQKQNN